MNYKNNLKLSDNQREVLIGIILGDAHLETQTNGRTYRLKVEHSLKQKTYVEHLYEIFKEWCLSPPKEKTKKIKDKIYTNLAFATISHGAFRFYAGQFYEDKKKKIPDLIHRWLTPKALAYWFMDDGSIKSKESKGVILNTQGYTRQDVKKLVKVLQIKLLLSCKERKQKEGFQIYISGNSYERFMELVKPYIIDSMVYKLPVPRKTKSQTNTLA